MGKTIIIESCTIDEGDEDFVINASGEDVSIENARSVIVIACRNLDCTGATIDGDLWCNGATITGNLWCGGAKIGGDLDCRNATIDGIEITEPTEEELILIREIYTRISDEPWRLNMKEWHCGTSHCLAGWCQVLREGKEEECTALDTGRKHLPSLSYLFFTTEEIVKKKLKELCE